MTTFVALLRGVNVGGRRRIAMADLRALLEGLGHGDVRTHLQSGNALFTSRSRDVGSLTRDIEHAVTTALGLEVRVVIRTRSELAAVVARNPFPDSAEEGANVHVAFLSGPVRPERLASIDPDAFAPDEFHAAEREVYVRYPLGAGRSKLTNDVWERRLGVTSTMRNWNTVSRLLAIADEL